MKAILHFHCFAAAILVATIPHRVENAAVRNVTTAILAQIKEIEAVNQNWDLWLVEETDKLTFNLINSVATSLKGFIPDRYLLQDQVTLPNLQLNLHRVTVNISDVEIHNVQHFEFARRVAKIKLGTYNGTSGFFWPLIYVTGFYGFGVVKLKNNTALEPPVANRINFTIQFRNVSTTYNWKLKVLPLRLERYEPNVHVQAVKVDVGDFGKGPLVSNALNSILSTDLQASINDGSLFITRPLEYGILNTFNTASWLFLKMVMFSVKLLPGGESASLALTVAKLASKLHHLFRH